MRFCGYCGKELSDGIKCNCAESISARNGNNNPKQAVDEIKAVATANRRQLIIGIICIFIMLAAFVKIIMFMFSGGNDKPVVRSTRPEYEKPVTDFVSAYNRTNTEKMMKTMLPSDYINKLKKKTGNSSNWNRHISSLNDALAKEKDSAELNYGKNIKLSVNFLDKKDLTESETNDIKKLYEEDFGAKKSVKSAYKVKVEFTTEGAEDYDINKYWVYVVEVRGDGWLLCPEGDGYNPGSYIGFG